MRIEDRAARVASNIKIYRKRLKLSQTQLAKRLGIDRTSLSGYEIGKRCPDIFTLWELANVFGVSIDVLVGRKMETE